MTREREQDAAIERLRERQRSDSQRPEAWLLRDYLKARRISARRALKAVGAAAPDRPALVACSRTAAAGGQPERGGENPRRREPERRPE